MNIASLMPELNPVLNVSSNCLPAGQLILVEEHSPLDGSFLFYYYSSLFLKGDGKIYFVCANESVNHYNVVSAKLGLMFSRHSDQDRIKFVPLSKMLNTSIELNSNILQVLAQELQIILDSRDQSASPFLFIIDSASILLDLCGDVNQVEALISSIVQFAVSHNGTVCTLVNRGAIDHVTAAVDMYSCLANDLAHMANTRVILTPIGAGFSKDVTGQMRVEQFVETSLFPKKNIFHYRLGDRSIQLIAPGLSQPALVE